MGSCYRSGRQAKLDNRIPATRGSRVVSPPPHGKFCAQHFKPPVPQFSHCYGRGLRAIIATARLDDVSFLDPLKGSGNPSRCLFLCLPGRAAHTRTRFRRADGGRGCCATGFRRRAQIPTDDATEPNTEGDHGREPPQLLPTPQTFTDDLIQSEPGRHRFGRERRQRLAQQCAVRRIIEASGPSS